MDRQPMGELLARLGQLSPHDIDEILAEQRHTRQRFGQIAVSLGFCQPEHVWAAWCSQLNGHVDPVDLDEIGIDAQARLVGMDVKCVLAPAAQIEAALEKYYSPRQAAS